MKSSVVFCVLFLATLALGRPGDDHYTDKYDNINVSEILDNEKLLEAYFKCIMDQGKCTPEGKELKGHIIDALETKCDKCTDAQKKGTELVIKHLINHKEEYWNALCDKYDPEKKYATKYEKELREVKG